MARALEQIAADHLGANALLHALKRTGLLIDAPVALARDEDRRHVDRAARKQLKRVVEGAFSPRSIPVQPALEAVALVFAGIDGEFVVGQPCAGRDLTGGPHLLG